MIRIRKTAIPGIVFALCVAVLAFGLYKKTGTRGGESLISQQAPYIYTKPIDGYVKIPNNDVLFKHQYVLVNFFASWCTPCLAEHPFLNQLAGEYDVTIVGVAWRDSAENISNMLTEHGNPYRHVGIDSLDTTAFAYGVEGLPESFLVGPDGNVVATHRGPLVPAVIREKILPHLNGGDNMPVSPAS